MAKIDVFALARAGATLDGKIAFAAMPRLAQSLMHREGTLSYRCVGLIDERRRAALHVFLDAVLPLRCDRCGCELDLALTVKGRFYFVHTEADLAAIAIDDSPEEALLGSPQFDLASLIEDEAILHLPISPRHEDCVPQAKLPSMDPVPDRRQPFAQLAGLRDQLRRSAPALQRAPATAGPRATQSSQRRKPRRRSS
ncbi:putative metal-binding protein, possibly nucleic-acid binding protein [Burkholderiales bacterium]|nr:putative metal-binding protein, possibly nucleic-acid binding protein [Burkholderiales bacterium]